MKKLHLITLFASVFLLLLSLGCKKDETTEPEQNQTKEFNAKTVQVPEGITQSNSPGAQQSAAFINMANGMSSYSAMMIPPAKSSFIRQKDGGTEVYTWEHDDGVNSYTATLKVTETNAYIKWEMIITGTLDGQILNNFTYLKAEEFSDGSNNTFTMYDFDNPSKVVMRLSWSEIGSITYFTFEVPEDILITMEINADGSGSLEVKEWRNGQYVLDFRAVWTAFSGEYWEYSGGELIDHGSW